jgi:hypothetical protein
MDLDHVLHQSSNTEDAYTSAIQNPILLLLAAIDHQRLVYEFGRLAAPQACEMNRYFPAQDITTPENPNEPDHLHSATIVKTGKTDTHGFLPPEGYSGRPSPHGYHTL